MDKKILIGTILLLVLISYSSAIAPTAIIGYVGQLKNGQWTFSAVCTAGSEACEMYKYATDPTGAITSQTYGGLKNMMGPEGAQAFDKILAAKEGVLGQQVVDELLAEHNPQLKEFRDTLKQLEQGGAKEVNAEMDVKTGAIKRLDKTEIKEQTDIAPILDLEKGYNFEVKGVEWRKDKNRPYSEGELTENSEIRITDKEGKTINIIKGIKGNIKVKKGEDGGTEILEMKGALKEDADINLPLGDQKFKFKGKKDHKINFDGEKGILKVDGKESFEMQQLNEKWEPIEGRKPTKFTPIPRAKEGRLGGEGEREVETDYPGIEISQDKEGNTILKGDTIIEAEGNELRIKGEGFHTGNVKIAHLGTGEIDYIETQERLTYITDENCPIGKGKCTIGGEKKGVKYFTKSPAEKIKGEGIGGIEIFGEFGSSSVEGSDIVLSSTIEEARQEELILLRQTGPLGTQMRYEDEITKIDISSQERFVTEIGKYDSKTGEGTVYGWAKKKFLAEQGREPNEAELKSYTNQILKANQLTEGTAKKLKPYDTVWIPPYDAGKATIVTPHTTVKIDGATQGLFTNPTLRSAAELREAEGEKLGQELKSIGQGSEGYEMFEDTFTSEEAKVVEELTVTYPRTPDYDVSYHLETNDRGDSTCCRWPVEAITEGGPEQVSTESTAEVVSIDRITGGVTEGENGLVCLIHYKNLGTYLGTPDIPWAPKETIDKWVKETDEGYAAFRDQRRKALEKQPVKAEGVSRIIDYEFLEDRQGRYLDFTDKKGKKYRIEYEGDAAGGSIYEIDPQTGKSKQFVGLDKEILDKFRYREGEAQQNMYGLFTSTGTARTLYNSLLERERLAKEKGIVKRVSY